MKILLTLFTMFIVFPTPNFAFDLNDLKELTSSTASTTDQLAKDNETIIQNAQEISDQYQKQNENQDSIIINNLTAKIKILEMKIQAQQNEITSIENTMTVLINALGKKQNNSK